MRNKKLLASAGSFLLILVLAALSLETGCAKPAPAPAPTPTSAPAPAPQPQKPIQIISQAWGASSRITYAFSTPFLDKIEKRSGGRIIIKRFTIGDLVSDTGQLEACAKGTIDMFCCPGTYFQSIVPEGDYDQMLFGFLSQTSSALFFDLPEVKQIYRDAYAKEGVHYIGDVSTTGQVLLTNFPINKREDIKGHKVRGAGGSVVKGLEALGASPVSIAVPEIYNALHQGTVDGCVMPEYYMWKSKWYEVVKYVMSPTIMPYMVNRYFMGQKKWDELGPELQTIVQDACDEMLFWGLAQGINEDEQIRDLVKSKGVIYTEVSAEDYAKMKAAIDPIKEEWAKRSPGCARLYELIKLWEKRDVGKWTLN